MTQEILKNKEELRNLIDAYAQLGDGKNISRQMDLFTTDLRYKVFMGNVLVADVTGRENMERDFNEHASQVKTYFTLNGQHTVTVNHNNANGVSFTQIKMVREADRRDIVTDYSVRYEDQYVYQDGKWLIKERTAFFMIVEARPLNN